MYTVWYNSYLDADKQNKLNQREAVNLEDVMRWNREIRLIEAEPKTIHDLMYEKEVMDREEDLNQACGRVFRQMKEDDAIFMANHQSDNMTEEDMAEDKYYPWEK